MWLCEREREPVRLPSIYSQDPQKFVPPSSSSSLYMIRGLRRIKSNSSSSLYINRRILINRFADQVVEFSPVSGMHTHRSSFDPEVSQESQNITHYLDTEMWGENNLETWVVNGDSNSIHSWWPRANYSRASIVALFLHWNGQPTHTFKNLWWFDMSRSFYPFFCARGQFWAMD